MAVKIFREIMEPANGRITVYRLIHGGAGGKVRQGTNTGNGVSVGNADLLCGSLGLEYDRTDPLGLIQNRFGENLR